MWWGRVRDKENASLYAEAHSYVSSSPGSGVLNNAQWTATVGGYAPAPLRASRKQYQTRAGSGDSPLRSLGRPPLQRSASSNGAAQPLSPGSGRTAARHAVQEQTDFHTLLSRPSQPPELHRKALQSPDAKAPGIGPLGIGRFALAERGQPAASAAEPMPPQPQRRSADQNGAPARGGVKRAPGSGVISRSKPAGAYTPVKRLKVATASPPRVSGRSPAFTTGSRGTLMISPRSSGVLRSPAALGRSPAVRLPTVSRTQAAGAHPSPAISIRSPSKTADTTGQMRLPESRSAARTSSGRPPRRQPVTSAFSVAATPAAGAAADTVWEPASNPTSVASAPARQPDRPLAPQQSLRARYGGSPGPISRASSIAESEVSDLMQRIGSLTSGRDMPASALPPIPRPPSITGRLSARPPSAAGSAGSVQRSAGRQSVSTMEYDLSADFAADATASVATSHMNARQAAHLQQDAAAGAVAAQPPASMAAEGSHGSSSGGSVSPVLRSGPGSGSSSQSGRCAKPQVRRWVRVPQAPARSPGKRQSPDATPAISPGKRQGRDADDCDSPSKRRRPAAGRGAESAMQRQQQQAQRQRQEAADGSGPGPLACGVRQQLQGGLSKVTAGAVGGTAAAPLHSQRQAFGAQLEATPPPLATGLRRMTSTRRQIHGTKPPPPHLQPALGPSSSASFDSLPAAPQVQQLSRPGSRGSLVESAGSPPDAPRPAAVPAAVAQQSAQPAATMNHGEPEDSAAGVPAGDGRAHAAMQTRGPPAVTTPPSGGRRPGYAVQLPSHLLRFT